MEQNKSNQNAEQSFLLVPNQRLEAIEKSQSEILALLKGKPLTSESRLNHVDEKRAIELVGKRATWFWQMRKSGKLRFTKVGAKVFYSLDELKSLVGEGGGN